MSGPTRIPVAGDKPYDVVVGDDISGELPPLLAGATRVAIVQARQIPDAIAAAVERAAQQVVPIRVPDGEAAKTREVAGRCWDALGGNGFTRTDAVVAVGGGAVTDLAGFVAATWLRGVRVVQVPTTLLAMVDAAVGGKTGINTAAGKNLVGAFHPPAGVLCDLSALATLPRQELRSGLAEAVKCGFIADPVILDVIEKRPEAMAAGTAELREVIERSVRVKAEIVGRDLREAGPREHLNYGHTLAHAIELAEGYRWRHGDAVSVGLVYAAALGRCCGRLDEPTAARHSSVLTSLGLPTTYREADWEGLHDSMRVDKKSRGARLRFVVLDGLGRPGILEDPDPAMLRAAYQELAN